VSNLFPQGFFSVSKRIAGAMFNFASQSGYCTMFERVREFFAGAEVTMRAISDKKLTSLPAFG